MARPNPGDEYFSGVPCWAVNCLYIRSQPMSAKVFQLQPIRSPWEELRLIIQSQLEMQFPTCQRLIGELKCLAKTVNGNWGYQQLRCLQMERRQLGITELCTPMNRLQNFNEKYAVMSRGILSRTTLLANGALRQCCGSPVFQ
jgi:hypothetical protein